jgi:hypothetical protein
MSDKPINDGGPAFPSETEWGMTLRDYFASEASEEDIQEFIPATRGEAAEFQQRHGFSPSRQWARYCHADAMLKAREAKL